MQRVRHRWQVPLQKGVEVHQQQPAMRLAGQVCLAHALLAECACIAAVRTLVISYIASCLDRRLDHRFPAFGEVELEFSEPRSLAVRARRRRCRAERGDLAFDQPRGDFADIGGEVFLTPADRDHRAPQGAPQFGAVAVAQREQPQPVFAGGQLFGVVARQPLPHAAVALLDIGMLDQRTIVIGQ